MSYQPLPIKNEDDPHSSGDAGIPILGVRQDANTSPVSANGDYHPLLFNDLGRLKTAGTAAQFTPIDMNVLAVQAVAITPVANATAFANVEEASNVMFYVTGTFAAMTCVFEGSLDSTNGTDGTWFSVQAVRTNANTPETTTGALSAAPAYAWEASVNALSYFRLRCTVRTSGTQAWRIRLGSYATEPIPASQVSGTQPVSGTVTATIAAAATTIAKARDAVAAATDTGVPPLMIRRDTPTTVTPIAGDYELPQIDSMGSQWVRIKPSTVSALTNVASSASNVTILALNAQRKGATIYNDSTQILYLKLGATASATSFTAKIPSESYYVIPAEYTGIVDGIWASANGNARVTELTS